MKIIELNTQTNEKIIREMTSDELSIYQTEKAQFLKILEAERKAKAEAAAAKAALLEKLGITEEEAKLLLGGN